MKRSYTIALVAVLLGVGFLALYAPTQNGGNGWTDLAHQLSAAVTAVSTPPASSYPELNVQHNVPVLVLEYFPAVKGKLKRADGGKILDNLDGADIVKVKSHTAILNQKLLEGMTKGSIYRGYKTPTATPALLYTTADTKIYDKDFPKINAPISAPGSNTENVAIDYASVLTKSGFDICRDYVDNPYKNVREVYLWTYGSNIQSAEWAFSSNGLNKIEYIAGTAAPKTLPRCKSAYAVLHLNYGRGVNEALHSKGHLLESIFRYVSTQLFNRAFVENTKFDGDAYVRDTTLPSRCGTVHIPPNTNAEYDYFNTTPVLSDCPNWNPDDNGTTGAVLVSCKTWSTAPNCIARTDYDLTDGHASWMIYWMQSMPGMGNTLSYQGRKMRNWWEFVADFNSAYVRGGTLTYSVPASVNISHAGLTGGLLNSLIQTNAWVDTVTRHKLISTNPATFDRLSLGRHIVFVSLPNNNTQYSVSYCTNSTNCNTPTQVKMSDCLRSNTGGQVCPIPVNLDSVSPLNLKVFYSFISI